LLRVEDRRGSIFGQRLELRFFGLGFGGVQGSLGDLVDVLGVEAAQLLVKAGLLSCGELVVKRKDLLLSSL
jgi:hypothetical protein